MKTYIYLIIIALALIQSCANPKPPTGGLKDEEAPIIDTTLPINYSTNIKDKIFILDFNEKIQLNQIEQNLFITPYIDNPFKAKVRNKRLILTFENDFKENTTYTLNFGKSIKDITERNEAKNIKYVFSTGDYLDSLQVDVNAIYPLNMKPCSDCLVSLYDIKDTTNVEKNKPLYFAYTNTKGNAKIENIKNNKYTVYVIKDENGNYKYDKNEEIAFNNDTLNVDKNLTVNNLYVINNKEVKQKLENQKSILSTHQFKFKKGIISFQLVDTNNTPINNIKYWYTDCYNINIDLKIKLLSYYNIIVTDSLKRLDTFNITLKNDTLNKFININGKTVLLPNQDIELLLTNSINKIDTSLFKVSTDSLYTPIKSLRYDSLRRSIHLKLDDSLLLFEKITLKIDSAAIFQNNYTNNKQLFKVSITKSDDVGFISGNVNCKGSYTLELLDDKYKILQSFDNIKEYKIENLAPSTYKLRIKVDSNNNGIWDTGNFENKELPEPIFFHKEDIKLRKGWEMNDINIKCKVEK